MFWGGGSGGSSATSGDDGGGISITTADLEGTWANRDSSIQFSGNSVTLIVEHSNTNQTMAIEKRTGSFTIGQTLPEEEFRQVYRPGEIKNAIDFTNVQTTITPLSGFFRSGTVADNDFIDDLNRTCPRDWQVYQPIDVTGCPGYAATQYMAFGIFKNFLEILPPSDTAEGRLNNFPRFLYTKQSNGGGTSTAELEGTWISGCVLSAYGDKNVLIQVSGSSFTHTRIDYERNTNCLDETEIVKREGQFRIEQAIAGGKALYLTNTKAEKTGRSYFYRDGGGCWIRKNHSTFDVTGCEISKKRTSMIFKIEGNQLLLAGNFYNPYLLPQNFNNATTFTKQHVWGDSENFTKITGLEGKWVSACYPSRTHSFNMILQVSHSYAVYSVILYRQHTSCLDRNAIRVLRREGRVRIGQAIAGGKALDFTKVRTRGTAKLISTGISWEECQWPRPSGGLNFITDCPGGESIPNSMYTIFKVEGNQLYIAQGSLTRADRPQNFTDATTFTKE